MGQDGTTTEVERLRALTTGLSQALIQLTAVASAQNEVLLGIAENRPFDLKNLKVSVDSVKGVLTTLQMTFQDGG